MRLLDLLNLETGASAETLFRIISTAPVRYKVYEIPKCNGGTRTIAHPARELKLIQRVILKNILDKVSVSDIAMAYVEGRGIALNAKSHLGQRWILKLDFQSFFHSIRPNDWDRVVRRTEGLRSYSADTDLFHKILFWGKGGKVPHCLSIGAPTSPTVSNLVCFPLDMWMIEHAKKFELQVTRYADDITISGDNVAKILKFEQLLARSLVANKGLRLGLNPEKRGLYGPGERRMVTGVVLTPDGLISIGRERKREISALIHRFKLRSIDRDLTMRAKGLLAFANSIEPNFGISMVTKYGDETISALMRADPDPDGFVIDFDF